MFRKNDRHTEQGAGKRRLRPILSMILIACYLGVSAWFLVSGLDGGQDADVLEDVADSPVPTVAQERQYDPPPASEGPVQAAIVKKEMPPAVVVKGLYVSAYRAGVAERIDRFIEICETTEVNALIIDIKDERGQITFLTDAEGLSEVSAHIIPDVGELVTNLKSRGIYTIARVVCFKDNAWSHKHPEHAIQNTAGDVWSDRGGFSWLDPYKTGSWDYIASVCLEAARMGFDEIQLDYVRFPADGNLSEINYGTAGTEKTKPEIISEFVAYIREIMSIEGVRLSADVFGIIAISNNDAMNIGQDLGLLLPNADSICPMIYPSHFANRRQNGTGQRINGVLFEAPDLKPYEVVYNILVSTSRHLDEDVPQAVIRPYLQDFTADYLGADYYQPYTAEQVRQQIQAVYDAGFEEWILWNHYSNYSWDAFLPIEQE